MNRFLVRVLILICASLAATGARGANPSYLDEFPPAERVLTEIKGRDARDTRAKQIGALRQLWHMVASLAPGRRETPDETRLRQIYNVAAGELDRPMMVSFNQADTDRLGFKSPRAQWIALCSMYEHDEALRDELLARFFSAAFKTRFARAIAEGHRVQKHTADELQQTGAGEAPSQLVNLPWYKGPAFALAAVTAICALWFLRGLTGEFKPFGLASDNTRVLRAGRRRYDLTSITGIVVNHTKATLYKTRTTRTLDRQSLSGETETSVTTQTVIHHFDLAQPEGTHPMVGLDHHDADLATGARTSVVNFKRRGKKYGEWLLYLDHDRAVHTYDRSRLRKIFRPRYTLLLSSIAVLTCLSLYARAITDYPVNRANFPTLFDFTGSVAHDFYNVIPQLWVPHATWWIGGLIAAWIAFKVIGRVRTSNFVKRGSNSLLAELDAASAQQAALGFDRAAALRAHPPKAV